MCTLTLFQSVRKICYYCYTILDFLTKWCKNHMNPTHTKTDYISKNLARDLTLFKKRIFP